MQTNGKKNDPGKWDQFEDIKTEMFLIKSKLSVLEKAALYVADQCRTDCDLDEHLYLCIKDINETYSKTINDLQDALQQQLPEDLV